MYDKARDTGRYVDIWESSYRTRPEDRFHQSTKSYTLTPEMIGNLELPFYAKALDIYIPEGSMGIIQVVAIANLDNEITTYMRPSGVYLLAKFVRRVVSVTGPGIVINVEHD